MNTKYIVDKDRLENKNLGSTRIFVRAQMPNGKYEAVDIVYLDAASLLAWLRSDGGRNELAENVIGILLGHGNIH
jgi:hypothetical protein